MFANRNRLSTLLALIAALIFSFALPVNAQENASSDAYPDLSQLEPETVVAVVNGNPINFAQVTYAYSLLPADYTSLPLAQILPQVVQLVIEQRLLAEEAVREKMHQNTAYEASLQFQADRLLQERYIDTMMEDSLGDEAIEIAYSVYATKLPLEQRVRARHILISPPTNEEADVRAALQKAQGLIRELNEGADFAALAQAHSDDEGSAENGGDLGFFPRGRMVEPFEEAAFALEVGAFTQEAVASPFGFHIIEVLEQVEMKPPLDEVRESLVAQLEAQRLTFKLEELRASADIQTIIEPTDPQN